MQNLKRSLLLFGALGLTGCGMLAVPKPSPVSESSSHSTEILRQGAIPLCNNVALGGNHPYGLGGSLWRQWVYLNDNSTPLNYSTFTTDLPLPGNMSISPYVYDSSGGLVYPSPIIYQYVYNPGFNVSGIEASTRHPIPQVPLNSRASYGPIYAGSAQQYALPVVSIANNFKLLDGNGNAIKDNNGIDIVNSGIQTYYPSINGNQVRFSGGQSLKLEFYLDPLVKTRKEIIEADYTDPATGQTKTDWVEVDMPYQEATLKVTTPSYIVYEPYGQKTYQTSTNPLPNFKFNLRGFNNSVTNDHRFLMQQGIAYNRPSTIALEDLTTWNNWLDTRQDFVLGWNVYNQKVASATMNANGEPVVNAATATTQSNWNLGTPGYANDRNCLSKTFAVEEGSPQRFSVVQPAAQVYQPGTFSDTQQGLKAEYFDNADFTNKRTEQLNANIGFNWGGYSPAPYVSPETYSVRWSGTLTPPVSGRYTLKFTGGSNVRVSLNKMRIVDAWTGTPDLVNQPASGEVYLQGNRKYNILVEYKQNTGNAQARLEWSYPGKTMEVIPAASFTPVEAPVTPVYLKPVHVGMEYVLAAMEDGTVRGWGNNSANQIGNGVITDPVVYRNAPVPGLQNISEVSFYSSSSTSELHNLALDDNGDVWAWGISNSYGELGRSSANPSAYTIPQKVVGLSNIARIYASNRTSLAVAKDGKIYQWGSIIDPHVQSGYASKSVPETLKKDAAGNEFTGAREVVALRFNANGFAILKTDGTVWTFGTTNNDGILGVGYPGYSLYPVQIPGLSNIVSIASSESSGTVYAISASGEVWTWGRSQAKTTAAQVNNYAPVKLEALAGQKIVQVAVGADYTIARNDQGELYAWGNGNYFGTGNTYANQYVYPPVRLPISDSFQFVSVDSSIRTVAAIDVQGKIHGWGSNQWCLINYNPSCSGDYLYPATYVLSGFVKTY
ncbi:PA14 domain-containing protein [Deinococcus roseus]|uniref:PA14 domain-containing protein n=1 Tax=Deinococcus roseus TaxID=392414 RepID=A0ABQ2D8G1_9DEIO|nr:PA14 domain-containing protein [Deinococcus roseus]GGJ47194.1 hypothetical protein GCM10008938_36540 [Deinococcus roseus]